MTLFLRSGSVNKLCVLLNGLLADAGVSQKVYPNRLHALLSNDVMRAVNDKTLALVQQATALSNWELHKSEPEIADVISAEIEHHWASSTKTRGEIQRIGSDLSIPPVVVEFVLQKAGLLVGLPSWALPHGGGVDEVARRELKQAKGVPDYSFQEVAIKQCRAALRKGAGRRVGLVSPTGSGKTEMALRIALEELHDSPRQDTKVLWVTHRRTLRAQAHQRLQKMLLRGVQGIPEEATSLLANRVEFIMVGEARERIEREADKVELIIIDEAHHAAAVSYNALFESLPPVSLLALTATPNRTDGLPIRIDEIGFTITFAELVDRNVILMPEFVPFPVPSFDWTPQEVENLADYLILNTNERFRKVLVIAPETECVEAIYKALTQRLSQEDGHLLADDDIGFVHSLANSAHQTSQTFIDAFSLKPRGILVSAKMLLEGFDDPQIDTVVITYETNSLITLMQAAGRCVRQAPNKMSAYVIQARDDRASYYFEQRWLYQDISDFPRPHLEDVAYRNPEELEAKVEAVLTAHNVSVANKAEILEQFGVLTPGETCRLLLAGLPYFGSTAEFTTMSKWTGALLTGESRTPMTSAFNEFCGRGYGLLQLQHLGPIVDDLKRRLNIGRLTGAAGLVRFLSNLFISTQNAVREVYGQDPGHYVAGGRPKPENHSTSWLKYITFEFRPSIPEVVSTFLAECVNRSEVCSRIEGGESIVLLLRIPLPLSGFEAFALTEAQCKSFTALRDGLVAVLRTSRGLQQLASAASFLAIQDAPEIPNRLHGWMDMFSRNEFMAANSLSIASNSKPTEQLTTES